MTWINLVIIAQAINAVSVLIDRYLLGPRRILSPLVYTFYVGLLSGTAVFVLPLGLVRGWQFEVIALSLLSGVSFIFSLWLLYFSLARVEASAIAPVIGAMAAVSSLFFSWWWLGQSLSSNFLWGFILLVSGTALMSYFKINHWLVLVSVLSSGLFFGLSAVLIKMIFLQTTFWNGFFWSRMANVLIASSFLLWPSARRLIFQKSPLKHLATGSLVLVSKTLAGLAFLLILMAINLGDVSLVNALGGVQFVFLIFLAWLLRGHKLNIHLAETVHGWRDLTKKITAVLLIIGGYLLLYL